MLDYARNFFRLHHSKDGKTTLLEFYLGIEAQGIEVPELSIERPPDFLHRLFAIFLELNRGRRRSDMGPCPLGLSDIMSWTTFYDCQVSMWEWGVIQELDSVFLKTMAETQAKSSG